MSPTLIFLHSLFLRICNTSKIGHSLHNSLVSIWLLLPDLAFLYIFLSRWWLCCTWRERERSGWRVSLLKSPCDTRRDKLVENNCMRQVGWKKLCRVSHQSIFCRVKLDGVEEKFCCVPPDIATNFFNQLPKRQVASHLSHRVSQALVCSSMI